MHTLRPTVAAAQAEQPPLMGQLIRDARDLNEEQIDRILTYQREKRVRFGEAAVALRLASRNDVLEALSRQFRYPNTAEVARHIGSDELVVAARPFSEEAEAFRELRSELLADVLAQDTNRALAVVSPDIGDGKSYVAANLAVALSQLERRTLLIDADLRTPRQHRLLGVDATAGLSTFLSGRCERPPVHQVHVLPRLYVLAAGPMPPNPLELVHRPDFRGLIEDMLTTFDHVVLDTPAAVRGADARVIAAAAGAALVIGRKGHSRIASLQQLIDRLGRGPTRLAGVVMNEH